MHQEVKWSERMRGRKRVTKKGQGPETIERESGQAELNLNEQESEQLVVRRSTSVRVLN